MEICIFSWKVHDESSSIQGNCAASTVGSRACPHQRGAPRITCRDRVVLVVLNIGHVDTIGSFVSNIGRYDTIRYTMIYINHHKPTICNEMYVYTNMNICIYTNDIDVVQVSMSFFPTRPQKQRSPSTQVPLGVGSFQLELVPVVVGKGCVTLKSALMCQQMGLSENSVPLNPMVLLIIIPFLNGYFIGNINPTFSDKPTDLYAGWCSLHGLPVSQLDCTRGIDAHCRCNNHRVFAFAGKPLTFDFWQLV